MILAAGFGTRLLPLTKELPKPVLPILGRPLLAYVLDNLKQAGVTEVVINLHHLPKKIKGQLGTGKQFGLKIHYSFEKTILGSGGGLKKAEPLLKDSTFFLINGDVLLNLNFSRILQFHRQKKAFATMVLRQDKNVHQYGAIGIDKQYRIRQFLGKPNINGTAIRNLMFTGVHVLEPEIFDYLPPASEFSNINRVAYPKLHTKENILGYPFRGFWRECGNPKEYFKANMELLKKEKAKLPKVTGVKFIVPVWIGKKCQIKPGSVIGPNVILGNQCKVGKNTQITNTIIWDEVTLRQNSVINKMIIGKREKVSI